MKFLRLCCFNRRLLLFIQTLRYASIKNLCHFQGCFQKFWNYASLLKTTQMLFEMTIMQSDASELNEFVPFLGLFRSLGYSYLYAYVSYDY